TFGRVAPAANTEPGLAILQASWLSLKASADRLVRPCRCCPPDCVRAGSRQRFLGRWRVRAHAIAPDLDSSARARARSGGRVRCGTRSLVSPRTWPRASLVSQPRASAWAVGQSGFEQLLSRSTGLGKAARRAVRLRDARLP